MYNVWHDRMEFSACYQMGICSGPVSSDRLEKSKSRTSYHRTHNADTCIWGLSHPNDGVQAHVFDQAYQTWTLGWTALEGSGTCPMARQEAAVSAFVSS